MTNYEKMKRIGTASETYRTLPAGAASSMKRASRDPLRTHKSHFHHFFPGFQHEH